MTLGWLLHAHGVLEEGHSSLREKAKYDFARLSTL